VCDIHRKDVKPKESSTRICCSWMLKIPRSCIALNINSGGLSQGVDHCAQATWQNSNFMLRMLLGKAMANYLVYCLPQDCFSSTQYSGKSMHFRMDWRCRVKIDQYPSRQAGKDKHTNLPAMVDRSHFQNSGIDRRGL